MFRGTGNSKMRTDNIGVGSTLSFENTWVIVAIEENKIGLLNLSTFKIEGNPTVVEDIHYLSQDELRSCTSGSGIDLAFSDFEFDPKGLKGFKIK